MDVICLQFERYEVVIHKIKDEMQRSQNTSLEK